MMDQRFADYLNAFVFKVALPVQLFENLSTSDFHTIWDGGVVLFCFLVTLASILLLLALSYLLRDRSIQAEFVQAGYRGSQALLGSALMQNLYGGNGPLALVLIGAVPLYNVAAVALLTLMVPGGHLDRKTIGKTLRGIVTNPIILGIARGPSLVLAADPPAGHHAEGGGELVGDGHASGTAGSGCVHRHEKGHGLLAAHGGVHGVQAGDFRGAVFAPGGGSGLPGRGAGGHFDYALFAHHGQLLQHGPQHGP